MLSCICEMPRRFVVGVCAENFHAWNFMEILIFSWKKEIIFSNFQYAKFSRAAKHLANPFSASALIDLRLWLIIITNQFISHFFMWKKDWPWNFNFHENYREPWKFLTPIGYCMYLIMMVCYKLNGIDSVCRYRRGFKG